ncbi:Scr1 family TA system antitoxin-like transcriptional regulator [Streptomyces sp. NPDC087440]|uniref:helix-turn-helix domain-containing protein n=1 Tax=Streptomyces sp. NPDC087440 TaxID=3365790 RepID=UPI00382CE35B
MTAETEEPDPTESLLAFFASEVTRVRTELGLSQEKTAKLAHTTQSMLSKIENCKRVPSEDLAIDLDAAFGTRGHFTRLYPLVLRFAYPSWFLPFLDLERDATSVRTFESQLIPGLLQTEQYARAVFAPVRPDNLEALVAARVTRQDILEGEDRPRLWVIIDEQVLIRHVGGAEVMGPQLERLLSAGEDPRTVIQVVPQRVAVHAGLAGPFTVLGFDEGPDVLYVEGFSQGRIALDGAELVDAARAYDLLRADALSHAESARLIGAHLEGLST